MKRKLTALLEYAKALAEQDDECQCQQDELERLRRELAETRQQLATVDADRRRLDEAMHKRAAEATDNSSQPVVRWISRDDGWFRLVECPICGNIQLAGADSCGRCGTRLEGEHYD